jgi:hypothetical protein
MLDLTPKQQAFALAYVETGNASEAYRQAYEVGGDTKPETIWSEASRTLADPKVTARVMELQQEARERTLVTLESLTKELDEDRGMARNLEMPAAAISAVMGKAKLHGLITDKSKNDTTVSGDAAMLAMFERIALNGQPLVKTDVSDG